VIHLVQNFYMNHMKNGNYGSRYDQWNPAIEMNFNRIGLNKSFVNYGVFHFILCIFVRKSLHTNQVAHQCYTLLGATLGK